MSTTKALTEEQTEHRHALVAALRSGQYGQGRLALRPKADEYCCMGVACDISGLGSWEEKKSTLGGYCYRMNDSAFRSLVTLPGPLEEHYGFDGNQIVWLQTDNDDRVPFTVIASNIEQWTREGK